MSDTASSAPQGPPDPAQAPSTNNSLRGALNAHPTLTAVIVAVLTLLLGDTGLSARVGAGDAPELQRQIDALEKRVGTLESSLQETSYTIRSAAERGRAIEVRLEALVPHVETLTRRQMVREEADRLVRAKEIAHE